MEKDLGKIFAENLEKIRTEKGISREELAQAAGVSISAISSYENATRKPPMSKLFKIADFLNVSITTLTGMGETTPTDFRFQRAMEIMKIAGFNAYEEGNQFVVDYGKSNESEYKLDPNDPEKITARAWLIKDIHFSDTDEFTKFVETVLNKSITQDKPFRKVFEEMADEWEKKMTTFNKIISEKLSYVAQQKAKYMREVFGTPADETGITETKEEVLAECQQKMAEHKHKLDSLKGETSNAEE